MNKAAFYAYLRKRDSGVFGTSLSQPQVEGCEVILAATEGLPLMFRAYLLATAYHETGGSMMPNRENLNYTSAARIRKVWPSRFPSEASAAPFVRKPRELANKVYNGRLGNRPGSDDGWLYRGGGQAHTTGRDNFAKVAKATGVDVVANPDLILDPKVSAVALVRASLEGWYTGITLGETVPKGYSGARRVINGMDQAHKIAGYAEAFERALLAGADDDDTPMANPTRAAHGAGVPPVKPETQQGLSATKAEIQDTTGGFWATLIRALIGIITGRASK